MELSAAHPRSSARHPGRTSGLMPKWNPAGVGWKPPGLSTGVAVPQTRVESIGAGAASRAVLGQLAKSTEHHGTFPFVTELVLVEMVPKPKSYIVFRHVPTQLKKYRQSVQLKLLKASLG